jgi:hypothetical protein
MPSRVPRTPVADQIFWSPRMTLSSTAPILVVRPATVVAPIGTALRSGRSGPAHKNEGSRHDVRDVPADIDLLRRGVRRYPACDRFAVDTDPALTGYSSDKAAFTVAA